MTGGEEGGNGEKKAKDQENNPYIANKVRKSVAAVERYLNFLKSFNAYINHSSFF